MTNICDKKNFPEKNLISGREWFWSLTCFLKIFFDQKKYVFDFLKVHLLVEENRFEVVSEHSRKLKTHKIHEEEMHTK